MPHVHNNKNVNLPLNTHYTTIDARLKTLEHDNQFLMCSSLLSVYKYIHNEFLDRGIIFPQNI